MTEESLFHAALAMPPSQRAAFLAESCAADDELRAAVEALLAAHEASGDWLDKPPGDLMRTAGSSPGDPNSGSDDPTREHTPGPSPKREAAAVEPLDKAAAEAVIGGRYTLVEKIGEGGMGEVWVAKQIEPVKRRVALKLIKPGMDSHAVLRRFEQERQALAMMDHPNIAKVLDGGITASGRPFFVMELVKGAPLVKFCDDLRLTPRERLELFVPICRAVQHAHQKGIVHRDLKPANILVTTVDAQPVPKVIDFGVAKATAGRLTDESISTQFGAVVGTVEYMSPEQAGFASEDIDTRADIYSLGVILYELLTGLRPIDARRLKKAALTEMFRIIQEEEPSKPSTRLSTDDSLPSLAALRQTEPRHLTKMLRGELDAVIMKCLEKQRDRRYETASALSRDIQRYLADEPVEARPPSARYRIGKFIRRHRPQVAAASLVLLALLAGIVGTTFGLFKARESAVAERLAKNDALKQKKRVEDREQRAIDAIRGFRDAVADNPELKDSPSLGALRKTLLKKPLEFFRSLREELQADRDTRPEALIRLAEIIHEYAHLAEEIADTRDGVKAHENCVAIWQGLTRAEPDNPDYLNQLAEIENCIGQFLSKLGRQADALAAHERALAILERLERKTPATAQLRRNLGVTYNDIGKRLGDTGRPAEGLAACERARTIKEWLVGEYPADNLYRRDLAVTHTSIAFLMEQSGRLDGAIAAHGRAREIRERLMRDDPAVPHQFRAALAENYDRIGLHLRTIGRADEALAALNLAMKLREQLTRENPSVVNYQISLADTRNSVGVLLRETGRPAEGLAEYDRAREIWERLARADPFRTETKSSLAGAYDNIGLALGETGLTTEALASHKRGLEIRAQLVEGNPTVAQFRRDLAISHNNIGQLLASIGQSADAMTEYRSSWEVLVGLAREDPGSLEYPGMVGMAIHNMATIDYDAQRFAEARDRLLEAIAWQAISLAGNPRNPIYRQLMTEHYSILLKSAKGLSDDDLAKEAEDGLARMAATDPAMKALDTRLDAIRKGDAPKDSTERLALAQRAFLTRQNALGARLWVDAFEAEPRKAGGRPKQPRYTAACAAAMAGVGIGEDEPMPDDSARTRLRLQALAWLRAELSAWKRLTMTIGRSNRPLVASTLHRWKSASELAEVREADALAKLTEEERADWQSFWADVDSLLAKTTKP